MISIKPKTFIAFFLLGLLVGAVVMNLVIGKQLERMAFELLKAKKELTECRESLQVVEDKLHEKEKKKPIIREIVIDLKVGQNQTVDEITKLEIHKKIMKLLEDANILGEEISNIDGFRIIKIVDGRILIIEGRTFLLKTICLIIAEKTTFIIEVKEDSNLSFPST